MITIMLVTAVLTIAIVLMIWCWWGFNEAQKERRSGTATREEWTDWPDSQPKDEPHIIEFPARKNSGMHRRAMIVAACLIVPLLQVQAADGSPESEIQELRALVQQLQQRVQQLEQRSTTPEINPPVASTQPATQAQPQADPNKADPLGDFLKQTTLNVALDGYYSYNFNHPVGRVNLLRAYDVSSNNFSLNQATLMVEHAPNVEQGRRFGARVDLQYGQATETLQGSAANELRPQVYRPLFQAYGTYVAPIGSGLTVDFGKWASALGIEANYTKDQMNYSRSFYFNYLPFYHFGFRSTYNFSPRLAFTYWLVNGAQQSEDFNGFKSQAFIVNIKPTSTISWNVNYYVGQEQRDVTAVLNPTFPTGPTQPGLPADNITPTPDGRQHIFDTYVTWNVTPKLTLAGEADYVINRVFDQSAPGRVTGGAAYARYQFTPKFALAGRGEYLSDRGGLFSGLTQALKETTITADYKLSEGFLMRTEWRRDFSNQPFFLSDTPGVLKKDQHTATLGLIWWMGGKQGAW